MSLPQETRRLQQDFIRTMALLQDFGLPTTSSLSSTAKTSSAVAQRVTQNSLPPPVSNPSPSSPSLNNHTVTISPVPNPSTPVPNPSSIISSTTPIPERTDEDAYKIVALRANLSSPKTFLKDLKNPTCPEANLTTYLRDVLKKNDRAIFDALCNLVAKTYPDDDGEAKLLKEPRILLLIKNPQGKNLLEQWIRMLENKIDAQNSIVEIKRLEKSLDEKKWDDAKTLFPKLPALALGKLCLRIWEADANYPDSRYLGNDYGKKKALDDINILENYKNQKFIKEVSKELDKETAADISKLLQNGYVSSNDFLPDDTSNIYQDILNRNQLQQLKEQLESTTPDTKNILAIFNGLDKINIIDQLCLYVWIAYYQPMGDDDFGKHAIEKNPRILLDIKNNDNISLVEQVIAHLTNQITLKRNNNSVFKNTIDDRRKKISDIHSCAIRDSGETTLGQNPIDASFKTFNKKPNLRDVIPKDFRMIIVAPEFGGYINAGGLANAVFAMAKSFNGLDADMINDNITGKKVRVVLPYSDVLPDKVKNKIERSEGFGPGEGMKVKYKLKLAHEEAYVYKLKMDGMRYYFIRFQNAFDVGLDSQGGRNKIYEGDHETTTRRWSIFQSLSADLIWKMQKQKKAKEQEEFSVGITTSKKRTIDVVQVHDSQTSRIPELLARRHPKEWREGLTPATVFTYHNNLEQVIFYDSPEDKRSWEILGLPEDAEHNSFISTMTSIMGPDMVVTVSEQYAKETQEPLFGRKAERAVKQAAHQGKLVGITNGNTPGFNPKTNDQLKNWKEPGTGIAMDLTFGPDDPDLIDKKIQCKKQLAKYLDVYRGQELARDADINYFGKIDPTKPIFLYVGRFDYYQKGIDQLPFIMKTCLDNDVQFICMGLDPQEESKEILRNMKKTALEYGGKGVVILCDHRREKDNLFYWQQGNTTENLSGVPGFGEVIRAAADIGVGPSIYEPCGLTQGEHFQRGAMFLGSNLGGFVDTVKTGDPEKNGYLFERAVNWNSLIQVRNIVNSMEYYAIPEAKVNLQQMQSGNTTDLENQKQRISKIMHYGLDNSWTSNQDGSPSATTRYFTAFGKAIKNKAERGIIRLNTAHLVTKL